MGNRRIFRKKSAVTAMALAIPTTPGCININTIRPKVPLKSRRVERALVVWYSQTGYTERNGRLLAKMLTYVWHS